MILTDRNGVEKCILDPSTDLLSVSECFKFYRAKSLDGARYYLLRISSDTLDNGLINYEAETLKLLHSYSDEIERKYALVNPGSGVRIHYDWLFPLLVDTFITGSDQGGRQANLLAIADGLLADYVPLVTLKKRYVIDARTAAWITGRFFKLQAFLDDFEIKAEFRADQIIIDPRKHRMISLNWLRAGGAECVAKNIKFAANLALDWMGLNGTEHEEEFRDLLVYIADNSNSSSWGGASVHEMFYQCIRKWWGHGYYPFTYAEKETNKWRQISGAPN